MTASLLNRPEGYRHVPASEWTGLQSGDRVWIYDVAWGVGTGRVDDVSQHQELLWVILEPGGRRLICGTDDVEVWAA
ncbi:MULTISPECIES: hypothetical protein [Paenarthrobacter]|uniref:Uncharacterized protein n=1 Tax=Paenarthrobacter ureafaciens TaxID=37931 RepID=A0AAX3EIT2_PAEUR|nr:MULTISPECIES: hypothetical protein [Paenarthrobacter]NKR12563.1 hypothetical protein [Arthrobacter sp. M5]NKR15879.1 hypothetical protein [Arthrobacter sp. M6]OEH59859.1 hypothetical protein A5N13_18525 [Arthrobacter sp. D4]OEH59995.1 hypothetical protein A5N17_01025 [Arthrobacter sp. D2]MDO5862833.1 hypothetical protein [Paenarthrobacter sp. SD-2]